MSKKWQDVFSTSSPKAEREARISNGGGGGGGGDERETRVGDDGNERSARAGSDG